MEEYIKAVTSKRVPALRFGRAWRSNPTAAQRVTCRIRNRNEEMPLLNEILRRTPPWVFVLFFVLLALGYSQTRNRIVGRSGVSILPFSMVVLSFFGVISAFGTAYVGLVSWVIGVVVAVWLGGKLAIPRGVTYSIETRSFTVPGGWLPLLLMMTIFFVKYAVGVVLARQLPIAGVPGFIGLVSLCYGFLSGLFLARFFVIWRASKTPIRERQI
jgi:hypothetical protein